MVKVQIVKTVKKYFMILMCFVAVGAAGYVFVTYYSFIFAKHVEGQVFEIRRVNQPNLVVGSASRGFDPAIMHSYAVAIRTLKGDIVTASGEDRKWEVVQKGICVKAVFYPYPPWDFEKGGTYSRARLDEMMECSPEYKNLSPLPNGQTADGTQDQPTSETPVGSEVKAQPNPPQ